MRIRNGGKSQLSAPSFLLLYHIISRVSANLVSASRNCKISLFNVYGLSSTRKTLEISMTRKLKRLKHG